MKQNSSRFIIIIGIATLVLGTGLLLVVTRGGGDDKPEKTVRANTPAAGTSAGSGTAAQTPAPTQVAGTQDAAVPQFKIPEGKQAVAVQLPYVPGGAGFVKNGDLINVFATVKNGAPAGQKTPTARQVLSNVEVLWVTAPAVGAGAGNATYLLALDPRQVEQVVFLTTYESLYLSLVPKGQSPVSTPGRTYDNVL